MNNSTLNNQTLPVPMVTNAYLFNQDPQMLHWEVMTVAAFYGIVGLAVLIPNYLTIRALFTTKALLYRQKHLIGNMAMADFLVGFVSIPAFLYNLLQWPSFGYVIYEGMDSFAGFLSVFSLAAISVQSFNEVVLSQPQNMPPSLCHQILIVFSIWIASGLGAALNVVCIMDLFPQYFSFVHYFYFLVVFLCTSGLIILVTCFSVMAKTCYQAKQMEEKHSKDEANTFNSIFTVMLVYIIIWMFPYIYFTYIRVCKLCTPSMDAKFFYIIRIFMYMKCIFNPIIYFNKILYFSGAIMRILTRECFGVPYH